ncbi:hypothetical protein C8R46DRAFT_490971 [Mycena filopes]|nr:hypothetical protein C8R46DRAFT_490971 [Mycena filopes]
MTELVLPPEIVAIVIDHIDDRDTLVTCSLVSLQWVSGSRFHMFRSVAVENMHAIHTLVELLESPLSTIRSAVRHLSVEVNYAFADSLGVDQAAYTAPLLLRLSNACTLKSLQFLHHHASFFSSTRSMETALFFPPWSCFRSLQTLSIGVWTSPDVIDFIASSFPDLRELEIDGTSSLPDLGQTRAMPPRALRVVRLTRCDFETVLNWLLPEHLQPSCSSLTLGSISDVQGTTVSRALHRCGPVLEDLSLTLRVSGNQGVCPRRSPSRPNQATFIQTFFRPTCRAT